MCFPKEAILGCVALKFLRVRIKSTNTAWEWVRRCEDAFEVVHRSYRKHYGRQIGHHEFFGRLVSLP